MNLLPAQRRLFSSDGGATWAVLLLVGICAFALRVWFILGGAVISPIVGDAVQYCNYAWNLIHAHTFSMAGQNAAQILPDGFRDPGYPLFLSLFMAPLTAGDLWYPVALLAQGLLGSLSAVMATAIARRWLSWPAALAAGLAVAVWPHCVSLCGYLLSETLFGFMIMVALWLVAGAVASGRWQDWGLAGLGLGAASMVNATLAPFGLGLAAMLAFVGLVPRRLLVALALGSLLLPLAWSVRGLELSGEDSARNRALVNLVQGSWPEYHTAYIQNLVGDPVAHETMSRIDMEVVAVKHSSKDGLKMVAQRLAQEPGRYAAWYAWKPYLLWAWNIRIGVGDVYPYRIDHPIYRSYTVMRVFESLCVAINPLLFVLMLGAAIAVLFRPLAMQVPVVLYTVALLAAYETCVYSALQSEPRYSIPLRPLEMLLAATAGQWLWRRWKAYRGSLLAPGAVHAGG